MPHDPRIDPATGRSRCGRCGGDVDVMTASHCGDMLKGRLCRIPERTRAALRTLHGVDVGFAVVVSACGPDLVKAEYSLGTVTKTMYLNNRDVLVEGDVAVG